MSYFRLIILFCLCFFCSGLTSCQRIITSYSSQDFTKCIKSVSSVMSYPTELESLGMNSFHAIGSYQVKGKESYNWISYVSFGTRYQMSCSVPVMLNKEHTKVTKVLGEAEFHLLVVGEITRDGHASHIDQDIKFGPKKWSKMLKHKDDYKKMLEVLDVKYDATPLPLFDELVELWMPSKEYRIRITP